MTADDHAETSAWFARIATQSTGLYAEWATGIAGDPELVAFIAGLPRAHRQPQLVFAVSRLLGAPEVAFVEWRHWLVAHWPLVAREATERMTQTNEPARCAAIVPALGLLAGPLALLEVGASAGLCLFPDHYSYLYDDVRLDPRAGPSALEFAVATNGRVPVPAAPADIVWRGGIDLHPLDLGDELDWLWLDVSVPPEAAERRERLALAASVVDPVLIERGDAVAAFPGAVRKARLEAGAGVDLVVMTMGTLVYLPRPEREAFARTVAESGAHWLSFESAGMVPLDREVEPGTFVVGLDGRALGTAAPHGEWVDWF